MSSVYPIMLTRADGQPPEGKQVPGMCCELPPEARAALERLMVRNGCNANWVLASYVGEFREMRGYPWAVLCFPEQYRLAGHIVSLRGSKVNMPILKIDPADRAAPAAQARPAPVMVLFVRKKAILRMLAEKSPLLACAWSALQNRADDSGWLCLCDPPPADWVRQASVGDDQLHTDMVAKYAEPPPLSPNGLTAGGRTALEKAKMLARGEFWDGAIECLHTLIAEIPESPAAWRFLGRICFAAGRIYPGRLCEAGRCYRKAMRLHPRGVRRWLDLGYVYAVQERYAKAERCFRQALDMNPCEELVWQSLARIYATTYRLNECADALEHYLDLEPRDSVRWFDLGLTRYKLGHAVGAAEAFRSAVRLDPQHARAWNNLGFCLAELGQTADAMKACRKALRLDPQDEHLWDSLGLAHLKAGRHEDAIQACLKAIEICPEHADAWQHLIEAYLASGRRDKAEAAWRFLAGFDPAAAAPVHACATSPVQADSDGDGATARHPERSEGSRSSSTSQEIPPPRTASG